MNTYKMDYALGATIVAFEIVAAILILGVYL